LFILSGINVLLETLTEEFDCYHAG
jgi:hypothetical protein